MEKQDQKLITIYSAGSRIDAMLAKSMLDAEGISYSIRGEGVQELEGVGSFGRFNPLFGPVLIQILEEDVERTREVLRPLIEGTEVIDEETLARLAEKAVDSNPEDILNKQLIYNSYAGTVVLE